MALGILCATTEGHSFWLSETAMMLRPTDLNLKLTQFLLSRVSRCRGRTPHREGTAEFPRASTSVGAEGRTL